ncbi:MAG: carboxyl-terminal processing protease [Oleiphilaceae bacterium]|jgi:carboxyl-terminal processing protease
MKFKAPTLFSLHAPKSNYKKIFRNSLISSLLASCLFQTNFLYAEEAIPMAAPTNDIPEIEALPLDDLRKFTDIFGKIKNDYVEEIDDATLLKYAIRGMLSGLDPHSAYLEPSAFSDLQEHTSGTFGGVGIEVGMENGFIKVIAPIDDTPAQKGGIEAGDLIIKLDETPVKGMSLGQAVEKMRGEAGTDITLTVVRVGEREPLAIKLNRAIIQVTSIKTLPIDNKYGYIRITQFQAQTGTDFAKGLEKLKEQTESLSGLIIDLRNNPGGVLLASVDVADQLIDEGLIVYTEGRSKAAQVEYKAKKGDDAENIPIIVLIDGGSASASEILAGALQDHNRAVIMGTQSFGKGSVQNVIALDSEYGLKLTTARYFTPSGRSIQAQGITPDIEVNRAKLSDEKQSNMFKEADLDGHLSNGNTKSDVNKSENNETDETEINKQKQMLAKDFQLQEALSLLKAIDILKIKESIHLTQSKEKTNKEPLSKPESAAL